jgi:hypothetical protein
MSKDYHEWSRMVQKRLCARGWKEIGSGLFSRVYGKGAYAIKVSSGQDDWEQYIIWATKRGYAGTFAPRVYCVHRYKHGLIALMERLDCTIAQAKERNPTLYKLVDYIWWKPDNRAALDKLFPGFQAFIEATKAEGFANDTHTGNFMLAKGRGRRKPRLVLIDPSSRYTTTEARRWRAVGTAIVTRDGATL